MKSIEDLARTVGDILNDELQKAGFQPLEPESLRFTVPSLKETRVDVMTRVSRTLPGHEWKVDFGIELVSLTVSDWLRAHSEHATDEHQIASSTLSKLRSLEIDLLDFGSDEKSIVVNSRELVMSLRQTVETLLPKVGTFDGLMNIILDNGKWKVTLEGRVAMNSIKAGLAYALEKAKEDIAVLRSEGIAERVALHYEAILRGFR